MTLSDHLGPVEVTVGGPIPRDVRKAIAYLRARRERKLSAASLARYCGVAERTLHHHFRTFVGISPLRYLHRLRLAAAREALLAGANNVSVTEVARRHGFMHFGRFSAQYRRYFGELPSDTRRRRTVIERKASDDGPDSGSPAKPHASHLAFPSRDKPSVTILPFQAVTSESLPRGFAESIEDGIAVALCSVRSLTVTVSRPPLVSARDPQRAARELGARYLLTGRIVRVGARWRVLVRVAERAAGHQIWGDCYDGGDLLNLQDRVVAGVLCAVSNAIRGSEIDRARRTRSQDLDAHGLAMRALPFVFASRPEAARRALEFLQRAMDIEPDEGLATSLAGWCHGQLVMYNGTPAPAQDRSLALKLAWRAEILAADDPLVLTACCAVHTMAGDFDVAEAQVARALALDPTSGWTWGRSGWLHSYLGNYEVAISHFRRALALDRTSCMNANNFIGIGGAHFGAGRYEAAAHWMRKALLEQPGTSWANRTLAASYARIGQRAKALKALDMLRRYCPDLTVGQIAAAIPFQRDHLQRLGEGLSDIGLPP
jgi:AraC-like DNA-binding protein/TolB-like protein/tetratricopeptide (TPR) repeat protein